MTERDHRLRATWSPPRGRVGALFAPVNNQILGVRFMLTALAFFVLAGVMALLMRTQLAMPENDFLDPAIYNQLFTMHGSAMMFLFIVPFLEGLALYFVPLMIGSRDVAFPRLTAFGYWTYLFGGLVFFSSFLVGSVPDAGWFAYPPLSGPAFSPGASLDFWVLGLSLVEFSGITAGIELVVTILKLRAPGMSLTRMPLFVWAILVTTFAIVFAFTTLLAATLLLEFDRAFGTHFFNPDAGGNPLLWQHLFWIFGHPEVYIMFIPATGIVTMIVATFARRPITNYLLIVLALVVTGFVSFGLWVHHMFTTGLPELASAFFMTASFMVALATGTQFFVWIATLWGRRPQLRSPMLFVIGFMLIFMLGGVTGVMLAAVPFNWQVHDSFFVVAHFHYVLIGGVVFPIMAGLHYWLPKITGRLMSERAAAWSFWLTFIGFNVAFFPMHILGLLGMPRRVYTYQEGLGLFGYNLTSTIGAFVLATGFLTVIVNAFWSARRGREAGENPWNAGTLEWATASPPAVYSFARPAVVRDADPLWRSHPHAPEDDALERFAARLDGVPDAWRVTPVTGTLSGEPQGLHYLPGPTYTPLLASLALTAAAVGILLGTLWLAIAGAAFAAAVCVFWLWPDATEQERIRRSDELTQGVVAEPIHGTRTVGAWGASFFAVVVGVTFAILLFSYLYLWVYSETWPQAGLPVPGVAIPLVAVAALLLSLAPVAMAHRGARKAIGNGARPDGRGGDRLALGLAAGALLGLGYVALQIYAMSGVGFSLQENAYASAFYLVALFAPAAGVVGLGLLTGLLVRRLRGNLGAAHRQHVEAAAVLWYVVAATGTVAFLAAYVAPHL